MPTVSLIGLFIVCAVAVVVPLALGLSPARRIPTVVIEIITGIIIGPSVLGWVTYDTPIAILSTLGLSFLLFHAGMEVELDRLRGRVLTPVLLGFLLTLALALPIGFIFYGLGQVKSPVFLTIVLSATTLGMVMPLLKDSGELNSSFGQLVIAGAVVADFVPIVLLSLFFSHETASIGSKIVLLGGFIFLAIVLTAPIRRLKKWTRLLDVMVRLQNTSVQIQVRAAFMLLMGFAALAGLFGLEAILGTFLAGAILKLIDSDKVVTHAEFHQKLEAVGFGVFIPIFFIAIGVRFNLEALISNRITMISMLIFLVALLLVRGIPAILYRPLIGENRRVVVAGLLQATSLPFIVTAAHVGEQFGVISSAIGAALITTGLLSALLFPLVAISVLRQSPTVLVDEPA